MKKAQAIVDLMDKVEALEARIAVLERLLLNRQPQIDRMDPMWIGALDNERHAL